MSDVTSLLQHGRYSTYTHGGCRCDLCRKANREYRARWKVSNPKPRLRTPSTPESIRRSKQKWAQANRHRGVEYAARRRALKKKNGVYLVTEADQRRLIERHQGCAYCPGPFEEWDHVVPLCKGGVHSVGNLLPACRRCNRSKGGRTLVEWRTKARGERPSHLLDLAGHRPGQTVLL